MLAVDALTKFFQIWGKAILSDGVLLSAHLCHVEVCSLGEQRQLPTRSLSNNALVQNQEAPGSPCHFRDSRRRLS